MKKEENMAKKQNKKQSKMFKSRPRTQDLITIDDILDAFVVSLDIPSAEDYKHVKNAFGYKEAFTNCKKQDAYSFLQNLPQLIKNNKQNEIKDWVKDIRNNAVDNFPKSKKSYKTYLRQFLNFVDINILNISNAQNGVIELKQNSLINTFKGRLRSQDRVSGDKIWLPLSLISNIFSKNNDNGFSGWLDLLTKNIYIHYKDKDENIKSTLLKYIDFLRLKKRRDELFDVFVKIKDKKGTYRVQTPTGEGNKKEPMIVSGIKDIAIDHIKPIDKILRELKRDLRNLETVSEFYKNRKQNGDNPENKKAADDFWTQNTNYNLNNLYKELELIHKEGRLRLMASKYNTQKSNGETFIEYRKVGNDYYGIMSNIVYYDGYKDLKMTLYQYLNENGVLRVCFHDIPGKKISEKKVPIDFI